MKDEFGMTLVEIMVATIALSIVVLAAGTVYVSAVREMQRATDEARVQIEASALLDHMYANMMGATDVSRSWLLIGVESYIISKGPGGTGPKVQYTRSLAFNIVDYYPNVDTDPLIHETIANNITFLDITYPLKTVTPDNPVPINNYAVIDVTAKKGRMQKAFSTGVVLRGMNPS